MQRWGFLNLRGTADEEGSIDLAEDQLLIGRTSKCKIRYADTTVSSVHAKLSFARETGEVWLEDCSVNGTWLGARRIGKGKVVRLHDGDIFSLLRSDSGSTPPQYSYSIELLARSGSAAPRPAPNDEEEERMVLAVQTAVADANRHSERVRQQAEAASLAREAAAAEQEPRRNPFPR
ncbi:hypothetical protein EMIHUDRAFT_246021 [Emiliania huxleyi CCMP1516]|uniref:FHA domain-containing protein n=2 Tax=Emiliania huxleyi TaxID=2903 RepID=A0A0D3IV67_EMIH1|nr:hypothetical protein EMIHUDRAFT_246021 [Emiliania huxleyi CCMP1516]EOD15152.1 hypothetical protein EMIHUDRAFT_246021 [Emiliania huxleyi CCMP1516]|eukprot:XP_005767581.1 hypothetical protein EMIHUDRAFT_246021 [Emiliania huxleyi CCMP1516]